MLTICLNQHHSGRMVGNPEVIQKRPRGDRFLLVLFSPDLFSVDVFEAAFWPGTKLGLHVVRPGLVPTAHSNRCDSLDNGQGLIRKPRRRCRSEEAVPFSGVLKITQCVLIRCENSLLYLTRFERRNYHVLITAVLPVSGVLNLRQTSPVPHAQSARCVTSASQSRSPWRKVLR